jgi:hypothetical protein
VLQCFHIFHVADVLADKGVIIAGQAEGVFLLGTACQYLPAFIVQVDGIGGITAGTPDKLRDVSDDHGNAVIVTCIDITVMHDKVVGDITESFYCFIVFAGDGFLAEVTAGHNKRYTGFPHKQVVQRCIGKHYAEVFQVNGNFRSNRRVRSPLQQDDGTTRGRQQIRF